jgi:Na+-transporting methylmalonyl-CoA/oxaloacetate decarboxylase gamma subunit
MKDSINFLNDTLSTAVDSIAGTSSLQNLTFDPSRIISNDGLLISVVGYVVVFAALLILFIAISNITRLLILRQKMRLKLRGEQSEFTRDELSVTGEINAAIGMALYLHFSELHDFESTVLTIKKVQKTYSPWSSKIYGLREYPGRK